MPGICPARSEESLIEYRQSPTESQNMIPETQPNRQNEGVVKGPVLGPVEEPSIENRKSSIQNRKSRGAPRGNSNALKHGFYSRQLKAREASDLDTLQPIGLQDEILVLRVFIRRLMERSSEIVDLPDLLAVLRVLSIATFSLTRLIRTQFWISSSTDDVATLALHKALEEVTAELEAGTFPSPTFLSGEN